jgi:hypothetical protein
VLFADAERFWKPPNIYDVAGALGLVIGLVSIWLTWWLAKRDIEKRLAKTAKEAAEAARQEVRRVARAVLSTGTADTIRSLELAREACRGENWQRAGELCELAKAQLARVIAHPSAERVVQDDLQSVVSLISDSLAHCRSLDKKKTTPAKTVESAMKGLDEAILKLHLIDARLTSIRTEGD